MPLYVGTRHALRTPRLTLAFRSSATSANAGANTTAPSDIARGDLIVHSDFAITTGAMPATAVPSGFTSINESSEAAGASQGKAILSYKVADGSEAGATLVGMDGGLGEGKVVLVFKANLPIRFVATGSVNGQVIDTDTTEQIVTASLGAAPLIVFAHMANGSGAAQDPRTFTPSPDAEVSAATNLYLLYKIYNTLGSDTTVNTADEGVSNALQSCYISAYA
jgi:hypothetical protein